MEAAPGIRSVPRASISADSARIALRPEQPSDEAFLFELYASTRREELEAWGWPLELRAQFLKLQFRACQSGYHTAFPAAQFQIVVLDGQPAGRLVVNRGADDWRVVDIALLPPYRAAGIGTALMKRVLCEATVGGKPVRLCVLKGNPALRFYQRLGFVRTGETDTHVEMEKGGP